MKFTCRKRSRGGYNPPVINMLIIDRFEGEFAVIEDDEERLEIQRALLPEAAKEGDVLVCENEVYSVDEEATKIRRAEVLKRLKKLTGGH